MMIDRRGAIVSAVVNVRQSCLGFLHASAVRFPLISLVERSEYAASPDAEYQND